ncbi:Sua5/YciO/YrdC/YwlC family protein, partial [Candidatus Woesearchaeota archaeon]|nr:Sua5/YciO/YrdC/YwlC family protein [Candidatus Woesearchaeota archaeon]
TFLKHCSETTKLGIRIPEHPITKIIQKTGKPFITTSANMSGKPVITKTSMIKDLKPDIIIDGGELSSQPSKILDLTDEKPKTIR